MAKRMRITVRKTHENDVSEDASATPEECLDIVEQIRLQAGKFLYGYPARLRRTVEVARKIDVSYLIVSGYAVAFHGYSRFTKDIEIFYQKTGEYIRKLRRGLVEFGFSESNLPESLFLEEGNIIKFGVGPVRIDLINEIDGVLFDEVFDGSVRGEFGSGKTRFTGRRELVKNKRSSG